MKTQRVTKFLFPLLALSAALLPAMAHAHTGSPSRVETVAAGPYKFDVLLYADPVVGRPLPILVAPSDPLRQPARASNIELTLYPGLGTDATPKKVALHPDVDNPMYLSADPIMPVRGQWVIQLVASGPAGSGTASIPITVAAPWAMPDWLGWVLGLSPLLGLLWFGWWQWKWLRREAEHARPGTA